MKQTKSAAPRLSGASGTEKAAKRIEITEPVEAAWCTAAYIAELTGELAALAHGACLANLGHLLARAQLEAAYWSYEGK